MAGAAALAASIGGGSTATPQAQLVVEIPTSVSEGTAEPHATEEPQVTKEPASRAAVTPRTDCLADEKAYDDPDGRFSVCYPRTSVKASTHDPANGPKRTVLTLREPPDETIVADVWVMTITWSPTSSLGLGMPSEKTCLRYTGTVANPTSSQYVEMILDGRKFAGCLTTGNLNPGSPPLEGQELMLIRAVAEDGSESEGYIRIRINSTLSGLELAPARSESVLGKLRIR